VYILGPDGHVKSRVDLRCSESEAIEQAKQFVDGHDVELWQLDRHIETFRHTSERPILRGVDYFDGSPVISDSA
jgi:hypothetical protein